MQFVSHSAEETERFGEALAHDLRAGRMCSPSPARLGMEKTAFTSAALRARPRPPRTRHEPDVHHRERIRGKTPLFHFDMYRLGSSDELFDIGWDDYLARGGVCAVEWSERVSDGAARGYDLRRHRARRRRRKYARHHGHGRKVRMKILALETSAKKRFLRGGRG